jgi:exosortase D (VPLPA-CTERM-specific)
MTILVNRNSGVFFGFYAALITGLYWGPFSYMVKSWESDDYSYCYLIPFIVLYLLWEKRDEFLRASSQTLWAGMIPLLIGISFFWLGELGGEFYIIYMSSWLILTGLCLLHLGFNKVKIIIFPLCMILTMFPFPNFINVRITLGLKIISSKLGVWMMQAYGMSAYREGNVIDLGFTRLQVVDACSGLRYLFPMIILSILIAYFYRARFWKKIVIVVSSIPLTIVTNALRIALTGILSEKFGSKAVEGFFHDFEGWLIFMVTLGVLLAEIWVLSRVFPESGQVSTDGSPKRTDMKSAPANYKGNALFQPQFLVPVVLLGLTLVLSKGVEFRESVSMVRSFEDFPMHVSEWKGSRDTMEAKFIDVLDFSDYIMADYVDRTGNGVNFYVAYYESQQKGESIHSPATCLRGGGWNFKQSGKAQVSLDDGEALSVSRSIIQKGPYRQVSYYWFPMRGRMLTNAFEMKWFNFWDALTKQRTDGALVRVIAPVGPNEALAEAEERLQSFIRQIVPVLDDYLPGK